VLLKWSEEPDERVASYRNDGGIGQGRQIEAVWMRSEQAEA